MRALVLRKPGQAAIETIPDPSIGDGDLLLKVRMVGFCGSDLNSFRGLNPLVSYPRVLGHEVSATVVQGASGDSEFLVGADVALSPYTSCGECASCRLRMPANSTRLLVCKGTEHSLNLSRCRERSYIQRS